MSGGDDIIRRLERGQERFEEIDAKLDCLIRSTEKMQADIAATKEIVEAWSAVKTAGKFIKWFGAVAAAIVAIGVLAKTGLAAAIRGVTG